MKVRFSIRGGSDRVMQRRIRLLAAQFPTRIDAALKSKADYILHRAQSEFVPVLDGDLHDSGRVEQVETKRSNIKEVRVAFGGPDAPHALAVHEHPSDHSPPTWQGKDVQFHPPGHGPKYLERPLREEQVGLADYLAQKLKV